MPVEKKYLHDIDLVNNRLLNPIINPLTTAQRTTLAGILTALDEGYLAYDTTVSSFYYWDGTTWQQVGGVASWGTITGLITNQTDLITYLSGNYYPLSSNPAGYITSAALAPYLTSATAASTYVPLNRNITINGVTFDLSADRTWTISGLPPQAGNAGYFLSTDGTNASWVSVPPGSSPLTAKGQLYTHDGTNNVALSPGSNTQILSADNSTTTGLKWVNAPTGGGISRSVIAQGSSTTAGSTANTDYVYLVTGTTTITLPPASGNSNLYTIKRVGTGVVTIAANGSDNIDGSASAAINIQYQSLTLVSDNTNTWNII